MCGLRSFPKGGLGQAGRVSQEFGHRWASGRVDQMWKAGNRHAGGSSRSDQKQRMKAGLEVLVALLCVSSRMLPCRVHTGFGKGRGNPGCVSGATGLSSNQSLGQIHLEVLPDQQALQLGP